MNIAPDHPLAARASSATKPAAKAKIIERLKVLEPDDFAEPVRDLWLPLPPSWNRCFKARAMPLGGGKFTAQVYKSAEGKAYEKAIAALAKVEGLSPWPKTQMLRFSGVIAMERAGCDMDDRLKVFFDALKGVLFEDDEQVDEYGRVRRIVDSARPGITATFEPIPVDRYGEPTQPTLFAVQPQES